MKRLQEETAKLDDALEPLAVLEAGYPSGLELTDVLDDDADGGIVTSLGVDDILPTSPSAVLLNEAPSASTSSSPSKPNSMRTIAVADSVKPPRCESCLYYTLLHICVDV
jgi:hypothetical protein